MGPSTNDSSPAAWLYHSTTYAYDRPVSLGPHLIRLRPCPQAQSRVRTYSLDVVPQPSSLHWQQDPHGNWIARLTFAERLSALRVDVAILVEMPPINPFDFFVELSAEHWPFLYADDVWAELGGYLARVEGGPRFADYIERLRRGPNPATTMEFLVSLNRGLSERVRYVVRDEAGVQTPEETLMHAAGSCRDSAWLLVQILRHLGVAARFVSGYLLPLSPDDASDERADDNGGLHAWTEAYIPGAGWIGLDPSSGTLCAEGHLPVAATAHFEAAAPISGTVEPAAVEMSFDIRVEWDTAAND